MSANLTVKAHRACEELGINVGITVHGLPVIQAEHLARVLEFKGDYEEVWATIADPLQLLSTKEKMLLTRYNLWQFIHEIRWVERIDVIMDEKIRKPRIARLNEVYAIASKALYPEIDKKSLWEGMILNVWVTDKEDYFPAVDIKLAQIHYGDKGFQYNGPLLEVPQEFDKAGQNMRNPLHPWTLAPAKAVLRKGVVPEKLGKSLNQMIEL